MIEETVKIHDKFQFELKFTYQLHEDIRNTKYNVETYIFLPNNLGVSPEYYTKNNFYQDIQTYIRLKTPSFLLKNICSPENSPFCSLKKSIELLSSDSTVKNGSEYIYRLKMFCSIFRSSLRDEMNFIVRQQAGKDVEFHLEQYLANSMAVLNEYRGLRNIVNVSTIPEKYFSIYMYGDEYLSIQINEYRHQLFEYLAKANFKKTENFKENILTLARNEISYRKNAGYVSVPQDDSHNETIIFRRSALKKFISSVLFLSIKTGREGVLVEQTLFGLAAALAMAFATSVAFFSKNRFQELTFVFFMILVVSYIFKDRMKDLLRNYISLKLQKFFFDHKTKIYSNLGHQIGILREHFSFVDENLLPKKITELRKKDFMLGIDEDLFGEKVMLYKKQITLFSEKFQKVFPDSHINGINDIIRMDVSSFIRKMDNPSEDVFIPKKTDYQKVKGVRVYHLNMIIKYSLDENHSVINRFRLVFNRNGIKRIEQMG